MANVWALKAPGGKEANSFIRDSLRQGYSRFGWSYTDIADLTTLEEKGQRHELTEDESYFYSQASFLLKIEPEDWIVHVNVPHRGRCMAAKVTEKYSFDPSHNELGAGDYAKGGDFRHRIGIDPKSIMEFDRNDVNVLPSISRRLKLQGRYWRIHAVSDFMTTLNNLQERTADNHEIDSLGLHYLRGDLEAIYATITDSIHKHHPGKSLEELIARVFEGMDQVENVKRNGSGWKSDFGADLIIDYTSGLPLSGLKKVERLVVQVKSYQGEHVEQSAVKQIKTAIRKFKADAGLIVSTAQPSEAILRSIAQASDELSQNEETGEAGRPIPIELIAGADVAKFLIRYGSDLILNY
jgi:hypothetical protein